MDRKNYSYYWVDLHFNHEVHSQRDSFGGRARRTGRQFYYTIFVLFVYFVIFVVNNLKMFKSERPEAVACPKGEH
jgi:hypothetical protein